MIQTSVERDFTWLGKNQEGFKVFEDHALSLRCGSTDFKTLDYQRTNPAAKSLPSCPTLCDPVDSSPPGSPIPGILQARTLEWVAISFSNA